MAHLQDELSLNSLPLRTPSAENEREGGRKRRGEGRVRKSATVDFTNLLIGFIKVKKFLYRRRCFHFHQQWAVVVRKVVGLSPPLLTMVTGKKAHSLSL